MLLLNFYNRTSPMKEKKLTKEISVRKTNEEKNQRERIPIKKNINLYKRIFYS